MRPHLKTSGVSFRLDETYVKAGGEWKCLYRAVDSAGDTTEFMPSAKRDVSAARRFFRKLMKADRRRLPFTIETDRHAPYPEAFETYIKVGKTCKYLYRAVDKEGQTIEFMLSAKRDVSAAKRFFKKIMRAEHRRLPFSINVDKNAAYPEAFATSQVGRIVPPDCKLRRVKYLNNLIEQDYRFVKKKVRASQCFKSFHTAERTLEGIEAVNMIRKGQVKRLAGSDARGQATFVASMFGIAA